MLPQGYLGPGYIALRHHTAFSLSEGAITLNVLIDFAKKYRLPALGLADTGALFGAMEFSQKCLAASIQPIIGCQIRLNPDFPLPKTPFFSNFFTLVVLAKSFLGYQNLMKIVSQATVGQPPELWGRVSWEQLMQHKTDLLVLSGGFRGPLDRCLVQGMPQEAGRYAQMLADAFHDNFYIEIGRYGRIGEAERENWLLTWAHHHRVPIIATQEAFFKEPHHYEAHDALICIADATYTGETQRRKETPEHFLKSPHQMKELFGDVPEALHNSVLLAQRCHFVLRSSPLTLPHFPLPPEVTEDDVFRRQAREGLNNRLIKTVWPRLGAYEKETEKKYHERLEYEMDVICSMGFQGYFLIVADFIMWAKSHAIPVGPGRGSGASSVVAWSLTITDVDPLRFDLLFERFLNPQRVSMPDFDVDFCQERRDEVIAYVQKKYGVDCVSHIITFGTFQARAVLRDVGRVMQLPYSQVDRLCKLIPHVPTHPVSLPQAIAETPQLQQLAQEDESVAKLLTLGQQLEGLYRHASTHAAGIVIGHKPLTEVVALYQEQDALLPATQFNLKTIESTGLVKFDFLGLKTLTTLAKTCEMLAQRGVICDLSTLPLDDSKVFSFLHSGNVVGIFQLESGGMRDVLMRLRPEKFEELIALVALYRPGPMEEIPHFIARRYGHEPVNYAYPSIQPILEETFGVMVYQEQVLRIAQVLAGYSLGEADMLRRAIGKKNRQEMAEQEKRFVDGTVNTAGGSLEKATAFFKEIERFANYAFPKAHAAPYALILYQTAYLKTYYPYEFMAASMNLDAHNTDKLSILVQEAHRMGLSITPPHLNTSRALFFVETTQQGNSTIHYALGAVKNVGVTVVKNLVEQRGEQPFSSLFDFFERTGGSHLNKRQLENLILAGAFDTVHAHRHQLLKSLDRLMAYGQAEIREGGSLFSATISRPPLREAEPWSHLEKLQYEYAALGFYLTGHPLTYYRSVLQHFCVLSWETLEKVATEDEKIYFLSGILLAKQEKRGKTGKRHALLSFSDPSCTYDVMVFDEMLETKRSLLKVGQPYIISVKAQRGEGRLRARCHDIELLQELHLKVNQTLYCDWLTSTHSLDKLASLLEPLESSEGVEVRLSFSNVNMSGHEENLTLTWCLPKLYKFTHQALEALHHLEGCSIYPL